MRLKSTCILPHFGTFAQLVKLAIAFVEQAVDEREISIGELIHSSPPKADHDNPIPFVEWFRGIAFESDSLPHSFTFVSGGGLWLVAGLDCHLIGSENSVSATINHDQTPD